MQDVDLYTVTVEDLKFESEFELRACRDDYVQALVTFFTVEFTKSHKRIGFSTSPDSRYTHWKQTVFYLKDSITIRKDETIKGVFKMRPNARNERDVDFEVGVDFEGSLSELHESNTYLMH